MDVILFFLNLAEKVSESDVRGGDLCSSRSGVHPSFREKRLITPEELWQEVKQVPPED